MSIFDTLGVNWDEIEKGGFTTPPDGFYTFEISEADLRRGTKNKPDDLFYVIDFGLAEAGSKQEWFTVAENGELTERARKSLGFLKSRLADLGVDDSDFDPETTDLSGVTGTLELVTRNGYQNIRNVTADEVEDEEESDTDAQIKARVQAKRAAREKSAPKPPAKAKPARSAKAKPSEDEDEDDNPFD